MGTHLDRHASRRLSRNMSTGYALNGADVGRAGSETGRQTAGSESAVGGQRCGDSGVEVPRSSVMPWGITDRRATAHKRS